jgi:hypothetical protein
MAMRTPALRSLVRQILDGCYFAVSHRLACLAFWGPNMGVLRSLTARYLSSVWGRALHRTAGLHGRDIIEACKSDEVLGASGHASSSAVESVMRTCTPPEEELLVIFKALSGEVLWTMGSSSYAVLRDVFAEAQKNVDFFVLNPWDTLRLAQDSKGWVPLWVLEPVDGCLCVWTVIGRDVCGAVSLSAEAWQERF